MSAILAKLLPLYLFVAAGYVVSRGLKLRKEQFARLLIYLLGPAVIFDGVSKAPLVANYLVLPLVFFAICGVFCAATFYITRSLDFRGTEPNILAFAASNANSGYFGIPVGTALFGPEAVAPIILCSFGFVLFENTFGFYTVARGAYSPKDSLIRVIRLPAVYAFFAGLALNFAGVRMPHQITDLFLNIRGAYSVLGMMLIGMAVADAGRLAFDRRFIAAASIAKFIGWPIVVGAVLWLSGSFFDPTLGAIVFFMSTLPLAANTVAVASLLEASPEKAAGAVLASTLLALIVIPLLVR